VIAVRRAVENPPGLPHGFITIEAVAGDQLGVAADAEAAAGRGSVAGSCVRIRRTGIWCAGVWCAGVWCAAVGRAGVGRAGVGRAGVGRAAVGCSRVGRAAVGCAVVGRTAVWCSGVGGPAVGARGVPSAGIALDLGGVAGGVSAQARAAVVGHHAKIVERIAEGPLRTLSRAAAAGLRRREWTRCAGEGSCERRRGDSKPQHRAPSAPWRRGPQRFCAGRPLALVSDSLRLHQVRPTPPAKAIRPTGSVIPPATPSAS